MTTLIELSAASLAISNAFSDSSKLKVCVITGFTSTFPEATKARAVGYVLAYLKMPRMSTSLVAASTMGMLTVEGPRPTSTTTPPLAVQRMAVVMAEGAPQHSMVTSGSGTSPLRMRSRNSTPALASCVRSAPIFSATERRCALMSDINTVVAPNARAARRAMRPMGPAPVMSTVWPTVTPARQHAWMPTENGSSIAASAKET
mmetsp:Transcript_1856/g.6621  ORF Transcript_1856/g.6621 Transcript_1856/m.6621 type:complete len:203 (+) Transcript_1856:80-688(+)